MITELTGILIAILAVGATVAGLIVTSVRGLRQDIRQDMARLESRLVAKIDESESRLDAKINGLDAKIDGLEARMREDMKQLSDRLARVEHSQAKLEGFAGRIARGNHRACRRQLTPLMQAPSTV